MKKSTGKKLLIALFAIALMAALAVFASAEGATIVDSGTCGTNLTWALDSEGTLTISGTGEIHDNPWQNYMSQIIRVQVLDGVKSIGASTFYGYTSLIHASISSSVESIGEMVFGYSSLETIVLNEGLKTISSCAFYRTNLTEIDIPDSVTEIGNAAIDGCYYLSFVKLPQHLKKLNTDLFNSSGYETDGITVVMPEDLETIAPYACSGNIKTLVLPESLKTIEKTAFDCSAINEILIPSNVTSIGESAFYRCSNFSKITITNPNC